MYQKKTKNFISIILTAIIGLSAVICITAQQKPEQIQIEKVQKLPILIDDDTQVFVERSRQLASMNQLFKGGGELTVEFDTESAKEQGFSTESILIAQELAEFTNFLNEYAKKKEAKTSYKSISPENFLTELPALKSYFRQADSQSEKKAPTAELLSDRVAVSSWYAEYICGAFWNPRPWSNVAPTAHTSNDRAGTLYSWGYHPTPEWAGGGWTRARTWRAYPCGYNSYRDHAYFGSQANRIWEQNYRWSEPNGEPNPEFWNTSPLPYATWAAYVWWWHRYRP